MISLISTQNIFHTSEFLGRFGSKLLNFGLMLNCFGPVRSGENIIGSVRGRGHKIYYFSVRSGSGQKIMGAIPVRGAKNLAPQDSNVYGVCVCVCSGLVRFLLFGSPMKS